MTIHNLLRSVEIGDHATNARYPDGSGIRDQYTLMILLDGHGTLLNSQVKEVRLNHGMLCVRAIGQKGGAYDLSADPGMSVPLSGDHGGDHRKPASLDMHKN